MAKKSGKQYLLDEDIEGALERYDKAPKNWKSYWFNICKQILENCQELAKKYIINPITEAIEEIATNIKRFKKTTYDDKISFEVNSLDEATQKCYLFEFYNDNKELVCSKVGTTTRKVRERLIEELTSKTYKEMGATRAIVKRVYDCGDAPAEGLESFFRAFYIAQFPQSFKKNDRFISEKFDYDEADKIVDKYMSMCTN